MDKIDIVKNRLIESNASLVVMFKNGEIREFYNKRVIDVVSILKSDKNALEGAYVADKVIGKVAATLFTLAGAVEVYGRTMSKYGLQVFENNNIKYSFGEEVEYIINNDKTGMCPMENKFKDEKDLHVIYDYFVK